MLQNYTIKHFLIINSIIILSYWLWYSKSIRFKDVRNSKWIFTNLTTPSHEISCQVLAPLYRDPIHINLKKFFYHNTDLIMLIRTFQCLDLHITSLRWMWWEYMPCEVSLYRVRTVGIDILNAQLWLTCFDSAAGMLGVKCSWDT